MLAHQQFNKKKNRLFSLHRWIGRFLILIASVLIAILALGIHLIFTPIMIAHLEMAQLRFTDLPPNSEFLSFEIVDIGNSSRWLYGELQFVTDASEATVLNFFKIDEFDTCWGSGNSGVIPRGQNDAEQTVYEICHWSSTAIES